MKEQWDDTIKRLGKKNSEKQNSEQTSKKRKLFGPSSSKGEIKIPKKRLKDRNDNARKMSQHFSTPERISTHVVSKESTDNLIYSKAKDSNCNTEFSALVEMAKEESRKEEENRKKIEILHESRLDQLLFSNGFVRKKVNSDGNCFFEASVLAMGQNVDGQHLRQLLCQHLKENVEEYIWFLKNRSSKEDDLIFLKEHFKEIDVLKQNGYWLCRAGDFLPLALANWSHRPVCIYSSRPEQPVI